MQSSELTELKAFPSDQNLWAPQNLRSINKRIDTQKLPAKEWNKFTNRQGFFSQSSSDHTAGHRFRILGSVDG